VNVLAAVLRVCDPTFADVIRFLNSQKSTPFLNEGLCGSIPRILRVYLTNGELLCRGGSYQSQSYLYRKFIRRELDPSRDLRSVPKEGLDPAQNQRCIPVDELVHFSAAAIAALLAWERTDGGYDPSPVLTELAPNVITVFAVAFSNPDDFPLATLLPAMVLLHDLLEKCWCNAETSDGIVRFMIAEFAPVAIEVIIRGEPECPLTEGALRFLCRFIQCYQEEDSEIFAPLWAWARDLEDPPLRLSRSSPTAFSN
jgi:hypothetical protein